MTPQKLRHYIFKQIASTCVGFVFYNFFCFQIITTKLLIKSRWPQHKFVMHGIYA